MTDKFFVLIFYGVENSSVVFLTSENIRVGTAIAVLPCVLAEILKSEKKSK